MKKEFRNRVLKYFIEQKAYEVIKVVGYLLVGYMLLVGLPMALGLNIGDNMCQGYDYRGWSVEVECSLLVSWIEGAFYLVIASFIFILIFKWFASNWWEATWKVEREIAEEKKRRRKKVRK